MKQKIKQVLFHANNLDTRSEKVKVNRNMGFPGTYMFWSISGYVCSCSSVLFSLQKYCLYIYTGKELHSVVFCFLLAYYRLAFSFNI